MEFRTLEITLQNAKDLNKVNLITKMDVYAVVSIYGGDKNSKQKTKTPVDHDGDANPTWDFPMKFTVDEAGLQMNRLTLDFKLICERALGDKDVGEVHVPIKELLDSHAKAGADGKQFVSYQVRKPSGKPKGQLTFSYQFSEKNVGTAAAPPHGSAIPFAPPMGKVDMEPVTAYPAGPSSAYPPSGAYPPPAAYPAVEGGGHYPPLAPYPAAEGSGHYPPLAPYPAAEGSGHYPPPEGYPPVGGAPPHGGYPPPPPAGYGYPPPPPGYGYPPPPPPGYGYPPQPGYGYPPPPVQQPPKKNKFGLGLGAGLLGVQ
ncbi:hypothetical protein Pfo_026064 [Paulownia fortunei]|nr:hypothetical protein Pfo_026064 [Paulownia fortunei]